MIPYIISPHNETQGKYKLISDFTSNKNQNLDEKTVDSFGAEWKYFHDFSDDEIKNAGDQYFDIIPKSLLENATVIDVGCGSGRWSKYILDNYNVKSIDAIDPSEAIFYSDYMLKEYENVRLSKSSIDELPFDKDSFDFGMSVGVLHHIPNTREALKKCVEKIKPNGHFYVYLYYNLDNKGILDKGLLAIANIVRLLVSKLPVLMKKMTCDIIACIIYMPFILLSRFLIKTKLIGIAQKIPLYYYHDKSFYIIRNDSLDRFGTPLEQRFSKDEIKLMMEKVGLKNIVISEGLPYYHAFGQKI